jgi:hypothetical protein
MIRKASAILWAGIFAFIASAAQADVVISTKATANMSCSAGVCSPTAKQAVLNATDLANMLASGDVKVITGSHATNIVVKDGFSWTSTSRLTLDAMRSVEFDKPVTVGGTGAVTITTNDGGTGGDLLFFPGAKLDFWDKASNLDVNGQDYVLRTTLRELARSIARTPSGFYALANDIDSGMRKTYRSSPVGKDFVGRFEGLGHAVSNLTIKGATARCTGLFNRIGFGGYVSNISVLNAVMDPSTHHYGRIGAIAGCNAGTVANSVATGSFTGFWVGGLVGYNDGVVTRSTTNAIVRGKVAGGVAGISEGVISYSRSFGPVIGHHPMLVLGRAFYVGGLAGRAFDVRESYATGDVTFIGSSFPPDAHPEIGGLIGRSLGRVRNSYATGAVQVSGVSITGGLVGFSVRKKIDHSYAVGPIGGSPDGESATGALLGHAASGVSPDTYWDTDTSGQMSGCGVGNCSGMSGLSDAQLKSGLPAGFDPNIWGQNPGINNGYPYLIANPPPK